MRKLVLVLIVTFGAFWGYMPNQAEAQSEERCIVGFYGDLKIYPTAGMDVSIRTIQGPDRIHAVAQFSDTIFQIVTTYGVNDTKGFVNLDGVRLSNEACLDGLVKSAYLPTYESNLTSFAVMPQNLTTGMPASNDDFNFLFVSNYEEAVSYQWYSSDPTIIQLPMTLHIVINSTSGFASLGMLTSPVYLQDGTYANFQCEDFSDIVCYCVENLIEGYISFEDGTLRAEYNFGDYWLLIEADEEQIDYEVR